jgi:nucleotide-binding universal stress UspA family protein
MMFRNILVPLDGSELAERILPLVEHVASPAEITLHLVRVVNPIRPGVINPRVPYLNQEMVDEEFAAATAYLEKMRTELTEQGSTVQVQQLAGDPASGLLDYERSSQIDLVAMCSHGRSGLARFALGSVAERLIRYGMAPVLLVRAFGLVAVPSHTVVPLDGSARAEKALSVVPGLSREIDQKVTLLRVVQQEEDRAAAEAYLQQMAARPELAGLAVTTEVWNGDVVNAIQAVGGNDALVVMGTHGRTGLARWALGSVADRVTHGSTAAVLLVRQP